jgi:hypothetical protein
MARFAASERESAVAAVERLSIAAGELPMAAGGACATASEDHQRLSDPRRQHGWTEQGTRGMRAKAAVNSGARAQAGAMLRLTRVMKNR